MGIFSLTTYMENRSQQYFENYELCNCNLVIDGHNLCNNLYNWHYDYWKIGYSPYCYGGDYDKHAELVKCFFNLLKVCNVIPYIVFDGSKDDYKASLVKKRSNDQVKINSQMAPNSQHNTYAAGTVALRCAFMDVIAELKLKAFTCISEDSRSMACLAKHLKCPVLSTDSDFFVSGAMFIPFPSIDHKINENNTSLSCKLYRIANLKNALNEHPDIHFLVPVLLGSNGMNCNVFNSFFKNAGIFGSRQIKIEGIFQWLKNQISLEAAVQEILKSFVTKSQKCFALRRIKKTIIDYSPLLITSLLKYFDIEPIQNNEPTVDFQKLEAAVRLEIKQRYVRDYQVPELFEQKFSESQYPSFFIDMLLKNRYLILPNIEDCSKPDANSIGYKMMSAIHNILVQTDDKRLTVLRRNSQLELEEYLLPAFEYQLPSIEEIEYLRSEITQNIILKILEIETDFCQIFTSFPKEWHLFLLTLKYAVSKTQFESSFTYSLIICFIILHYVDSKLDKFCRCVEELNCMHTVPQSAQNSDSSEKQNEFPNISQIDSLALMHKIIKHFHLNPEDNAHTYDRSIMHSIAEFQCVFLHLKYLNNLLNFPYEDASIYQVFDGTFIYNMTKHLRRETNLKKYLTSFLQDCPSILYQINFVIELLEKYSIL